MPEPRLSKQNYLMNSLYAVIIEDDPILSEIFTTVMQQAGFETSLDAEGNNYEALLENRRPNLIILDMHLPYASGREIMAKIRAQEKFNNIKILFTTGDFHVANEMQGVADFVLVKPVRVNRLLEIASLVRAN